MSDKKFTVWDLFKWNDNAIVPTNVEKLTGWITKFTFKTEEEAKEYSKIYTGYNISVTWRFVTIKPIDEKLNKNIPLK